MLGYGVCKALDQHCILRITGRRNIDQLKSKLKGQHTFISDVEINQLKSISDIKSIFGQPEDIDFIVNCVGYISHNLQGLVSGYYNTLEYLATNIGFPLLLSEVYGSKLIHPSSDSVFNGKNAPYSENSIGDPDYDLYGYSKLCSEKISPNSTVLRACIIGEELETKKHLLEWFRYTENDIKGFTNWFCTPITSIEFGNLCLRLFQENTLYPMLMNLATERVSKYTLLQMYNKKRKLNKYIQPIEYHRYMDKSLKTKYDYILKLPTLEQMMDRLIEED